MNTDERLGTFDQVIAAHTPAIQEMARALRALMLEVDPETYEVPRAREGAASYGVGPSKMKQAYCYIMPQKEYVNLGFFHGVGLADDDGLLEGSGKAMRHIKISSMEQVHAAAIRRLVVLAFQDRQAIATQPKK